MTIFSNPQSSWISINERNYAGKSVIFSVDSYNIVIFILKRSKTTFTNCPRQCDLNYKFGEDLCKDFNVLKKNLARLSARKKLVNLWRGNINV